MENTHQTFDGRPLRIEDLLPPAGELHNFIGPPPPPPPPPLPIDSQTTDLKYAREVEVLRRSAEVTALARLSLQKVKIAEERLREVERLHKAMAKEVDMIREVSRNLVDNSCSSANLALSVTHFSNYEDVYKIHPEFSKIIELKDFSHIIGGGGSRTSQDKIFGTTSSIGPSPLPCTSSSSTGSILCPSTTESCKLDRPKRFMSNSKSKAFSDCKHESGFNKPNKRSRVKSYRNQTIFEDIPLTNNRYASTHSKRQDGSESSFNLDHFFTFACEANKSSASKTIDNDAIPSKTRKEVRISKQEEPKGDIKDPKTVIYLPYQPLFPDKMTADNSMDPTCSTKDCVPGKSSQSESGGNIAGLQVKNESWSQELQKTLHLNSPSPGFYSHQPQIELDEVLVAYLTMLAEYEAKLAAFLRNISARIAQKGITCPTTSDLEASLGPLVGSVSEILEQSAENHGEFKKNSTDALINCTLPSSSANPPNINKLFSTQEKGAFGNTIMKATPRQGSHIGSSNLLSADEKASCSVKRGGKDTRFIFQPNKRSQTGVNNSMRRANTKQSGDSR